jgi:hypothetical protein
MRTWMYATRPGQSYSRHPGRPSELDQEAPQKATEATLQCPSSGARGIRSERLETGAIGNWGADLLRQPTASFCAYTELVNGGRKGLLRGQRKIQRSP